MITSPGAGFCGASPPVLLDVAAVSGSLVAEVSDSVLSLLVVPSLPVPLSLPMLESSVPAPVGVEPPWVGSLPKPLELGSEPTVHAKGARTGRWRG